MTVTLEQPAYTFREDAGEASVVLVARAVPGLPYVSDFPVSVSSGAEEASSNVIDGVQTGDYIVLSRMVPFASSDFGRREVRLLGEQRYPSRSWTTISTKAMSCFTLTLNAPRACRERSWRWIPRVSNAPPFVPIPIG